MKRIATVIGAAAALIVLSGCVADGAYYGDGYGGGYGGYGYAYGNSYGSGRYDSRGYRDRYRYDNGRYRDRYSGRSRYDDRR